MFGQPTAMLADKKIQPTVFLIKLIGRITWPDKPQLFQMFALTFNSVFA